MPVMRIEKSLLSLWVKLLRSVSVARYQLKQYTTMKQLLRFSILVLALLLPATAVAHIFEVDGIYYNINGNEVSVTYKGSYESL